MRVVAGIAKGRKLKAPRTPGTRPILDRVKVALFDILGDQVVDSAFLDLFAGSGSVGIEALSRGARRAVFVDTNPGAIRLIKDNLALTGLGDKAETVRIDAFRYLALHREEQFDIIYVAPPQYKGLAVQTLRALDDLPILSDRGLVITQIDPRERAELELEHLTQVKQRKYGNTLLSFYELR
ncbi:MAG: 16S rRNA (guanine(966)-N(2))-methyltransferase RsmD [Chloroflexi bacterium]|nr:16S rRNA (guanine(966)-N(2))-methyltransferase RsmD [Chloroflexota bacterium]